ncbi:MAG: S26 family signal peptidase [Campylobacteraceae bacterium]|jgi:conjugative transfer signal peptidase TraF|nr:S26 family signal peptidase [Campylobacteraceae bacterium]
MREKIVIFLFSMIVILPIICFYTKGYRLNLTRSLPVGIYKATPITSDTVFLRGDIVIFCPSIEVAKYTKEKRYLDYGITCSNNVIPMQKMIVALYGDNATIKDSVLYVNNQTFQIVNEDKNGLIELNYKGGIVKQGYFLALTDANYGFDSRYFGEVALENIIAKTSIVLKFWE